MNSSHSQPPSAHDWREDDSSVDPSILRSLTDEQKSRLTDILDRYLVALEQSEPPPADELLAENPDLAEALEWYLAELRSLHDAAASAAGAGRPALDTRSSEPISRRLGDFVLGDEIGRGGMGVVYEAEQISLGRRVALKILPFAAVLDPKQITRFKNEARAAAQLQHPNIVPVYAIGTERGVHYFAMQWIDGQPLDAVIRQWRGDQEPPAQKPVGPATSSDSAVRLPASTVRMSRTRGANERRERYDVIARLGVQAAEALHAAHECGIVHRDIKPSNLLLDQQGKLWVTDFGLARIQSDVPVSRTGDVVGTLRYMSPEQARGMTTLVDHRADIYSLGATLYELLALRPAFDQEDGPALLRQIGDEEPRKLGTFCPDIPPDLETVVHKAMSKHREERYATAADFAADLRCVLEGRPTVARPPTIVQYVAKWTRRHHRWVTAAIVVGCCAFAGSLTATALILREKHRAESNWQRADQNFHEARTAVGDLGLDPARQLADVPGADQVRLDLLRRALRYYQSFVQQAGSDPELRADIALSLHHIGTLSLEVGSAEEAATAHSGAAQLYHQLTESNPGQFDYRQRWAVSLNNYAQAERVLGHMQAARESLEHAIGIQESLLSYLPDQRKLLGELALSYSNYGLLLTEMGSDARAEKALRDAIRIQRRLVQLEPDNPLFARQLASAINNLTAVLVEQQPTRAIDYYREILELLTPFRTTHSENRELAAETAVTWNNLGSAQSRLRKYRDAVDAHSQAISILEQIERAAPGRRSSSHSLALSLNNRGVARRNLREFAEAENDLRWALELYDELNERFPSEVAFRSELAVTWNNLGSVLEESGKFEDALAAFQQAIAHQKQALAENEQRAAYRDGLSRHYFNCGRVLRRLGRLSEAVDAALARQKLWPGDARRLVTVAEELALASRLAATRPPTDPDSVRSNPDAAMDSRRWAELAIDLLEEALAAGLDENDPAFQSEAFAPLRDNPRFSKLNAAK